MAVSLETIRKLTIMASSQGVDAVRAQLEGIDRAQQGVVRSADQMRVVNDNNSKSFISAGKAFDNLERAIDPVARANVRLAGDLKKVQDALNEGAIGADRAANALAALGRRHEEAIAKATAHSSALNSMGSTVDSVVAKMGAFYQSSASMVGRLDAWTESIRRLNEEANKPLAPMSPMAAAMGQHYRETTSFSGRLASWQADQARSEEARNRAPSPIAETMGAYYAQSTSMVGRLDSWTASQKKLTEGTAANTKEVALNRAEWINLSRQMQDVGVSLYSGQAPMTVLVQQGAQIADVFGSSRGGAGAALSEFGAVAARVATSPITLVAAVSISAGLAMMRWKEQVDALTVSLNGLGRASGLTVSGASAIAERAATGANISNASARGMAAQFLGAGVRGPAIGEAIGVSRDFSRKLGLSEDDAIKTLASDLADPARGAEELSRKFGLLSYSQRQEIQQLQDMGDKAGAASKLIKAVSDRLKEMDDPTWRFVKTLDGMKKSLLDSFDTWGHLVYDPVGFFSGNKTPSQQKDEQNAQINATRAALDDAIGRQLGLDKIASDAALAAKEITAQTFAEREAIVMEKGRQQALLDTEHATQRLMEAEAERLRMMAEAQRKVEDYARSGARDRYIEGADTPYERMRRQNRAEADDLLRQIPSTVSSVGRPAVHRDVAAPDVSGGTRDLLAEATRRGLDPTEANFQKLIDEGVGAGKFRGRLINMNAGFNQTTVDVPNIDAGRMRNQVLSELEQKDRAGGQKMEKDFLKGVNDDLTKQEKLLQAQTGAFGKSTEEVAKAVKQQELWNKVNELGIPKTEDLTKAIEKQADRTGRLAKAKEDADKFRQKTIDERDAIRGGFGDTLGDAVKTAAHGGNVGKSFENSLNNIGDSLLSNATSMITDSLLGKKGGTDNGLLGGVLGSLGIPGFSNAAGQSVGEMNVSAATVNVSGGTGIPGIGGASGAATGGILGDIFGGLKKLWPFEDGGVMTSRGPIPLRRYADGGIASSPQLAMFGEGSGPEAYVPLKNGGIPVQIRMAREAASQSRATTSQPAVPNTEVHVHNAPPGTQTKESQTSAGGRRVDVMFADAVGGALQTGAGRRGLAMATSRPVQR